MAAAKKTEKKKSSGGPKFNKSSKKPFKTKKDMGKAVKSEAVSLQLEDDVPDFPRGGGSSLSRREREKIYAEVDEEFQTEGAKFIKKNGKKVKKKRPQTEDDLGTLFSDGITGKLPRYANKITSKNISPGMKLLGVIGEVNEKDLVISLPGGLRGLVRAVDAFDPVMDDEVEDMEDTLLPTFFHVGQLVSSVVLQLDDDKKEKEKGKRKIWLSLRLSVLYKAYTLAALQEGMILTSYVKSIEDHGYILHFGVPSFSGFLPKNSQPERKDNDVRIGQLVQGVVRSIDKTRKVVYLVSDPEMVSKNVTKDLKGISMDLLVPGMMVIGRVQSTLENGVMLSFLTYFTGTVDMYHLQNSYPSKDWKDDYNQNKKVNARILFIDPSTRAIGLTLNPHLVHNKAPPSHVKIGDIYEDSKVVRVDRGLGLLLEIQSSPVSIPAYVSISDVSEGEVQKLEKKFREGSRVRVRVLGFRHLEGLATGMLKASAFEGAVFTHSDVKPGMVVKAKIIAVDSFGAIVQFPGGIKALCPLRHMSEFEIAKPGKKFKVGADLVFRVLGCKSKRITVTHKKTLVKSKHEILSSYANVSEGLITHGWITKIEKHGCFVRFYNGVQGFAPRSELGLEVGADASSMYHVGQVIKCRITSTSPSSRRINLSFVIKPKRVPEDEIIKIGRLVTGVVDDITPDSIVVYVNEKAHSKGTIRIEHLADHHVHAALMKSVLKPGVEFDELLVLDIEGNNLILSAKHSLICSATRLPSDLSQITPNAVVHGYVCNLIEIGCFVRFLGRLTGFSPRRMATDDRKIQLSEAYHVGQSVRSNILDVNSDTGRMTLSLKLSNCSSIDASFIQEYFITEEKIARLQSSDSTGPELKWVEGFDIGSVVEGKVQEVKDIGVVLSFEKYKDVFGFITLHELGGSTVESGSAVQAAVLDVAKAERVVDLSLKPEFVNKVKETSKKKRKREGIDDLEVNQVVKAIVEIVKENYLVLSLPEYDYAIGYASVVDYNTQRLPQKLLMSGQSVSASVMALPSSSTVGRLLLLLNSTSGVTETSSSKREKKKSSYKVGYLVQAEITEIRPLEMRLKFGIGFHGRVHITELDDDYDNVAEAPFSNFRIGQTVTARIVAKANQSHNNKKSSVLELSIKPKTLANFSETVDDLMDEDLNFSIGQYVTGYISNVNNDWAWLTVTRHMSAQLFILDSSCEPSELLEFSKRFHVGKPISGHVLSMDKGKKVLRLIARPLSVSSPGSFNREVLKMGDDPHNSLDEKEGSYIHKGDIVGGKISKILPGVGGMHVQISPNIYGKIHFTELTDSWEPNPLSGYQEGNFVKCKVLEITHPSKGTIHVDLSLRSSLMTENNNLKISVKRVETFEDLIPKMEIQGYVKSVTPKGCFILLSRSLEAKILLSNLSDGYVDDLVKEFSIGKLIKGRIASLEPLSRRVEVTLKTPNASGASKSKMCDLSSLHVGEIVNGRIKRVESYGLFITIEHTNMVGLCHVSELLDDPIDKLETKYRAGEKVTAKILKVDEERHRISLGMKSSHVLDKSNSNDMPSKQEPDQPSGDDDSADESELDISLDNDSFQERNEDVEFPALVQAESRAYVPPLEVTLDELNQEDMDIVFPQSEEHFDVSDAANEKNKRREKKKAKEEKEREIRAAEERLLEKDVPRTSDEFEKLIRNSPNSSYLWIKYMAFMVSMADVEKARSIAERALKTINIREEKEKLNVWVVYFNLENKYGNPPEEAVKKVFQRALQVNDPKKVNLSLLGVYERTEQHKLADELLDKMVKKFKHSCKVWLKRVQRLLNRQQDGVQSVVNRALLCLPQHKHIKFISQTAILEFKSGIPERGRSMFEGILREYPKRTDLWSIYLDQEFRLGDVDLIRALFERAISLSLPPKKMKFLFKKYLEYEKTLGDEERIKSVKQKALDYVESTLA